MKIPFFLTVDTEGDNIWDRPEIIRSGNVENLYRFQELCNQYNIKPIYLTNYEAAINKKFQQFTQEYLNKLEIGMHLHAWNSPPIKPLTENDLYYQPYLHEYPKDVIFEKIDYMVKLLQDTFQTDILSHRGGRYSNNETIFESLVNNGIRIDCSIVPGFNYKPALGSPHGMGGPDFRHYPLNKYEIYPGLEEFPVSVFRVHALLNGLEDKNLLKRVIGKLLDHKTLVLRSKLDNFEEMKKVIDWNLKLGTTHLEYIIHSSELVTNKSHLIKNKEEENSFYNTLEKLFKYLSTLDEVEPMTFKEYLQKN